MKYHEPLTESEQQAAGVARPTAFALADKVRFNEIDALNHVNNVAYLVWFETARVRYLRHFGLSEFGPDDPRIVIYKGEFTYLEEMLSEQSYIVTCRCVEFRNSSFTLENEVWVGPRLTARFRCVIVVLEQNGSAKMALPAKFIQTFEMVDGASRAT